MFVTIRPAFLLIYTKMIFFNFIHKFSCTVHLNITEVLTLLGSIQEAGIALFFKEALSGLRQFLATERCLESAFYFSSKAFSVLKFLS